MIASAQANTPQAKFLAMLPAIEARAQVAFGGFPPEVQEDAVSEVVARCYLDYIRLVERGKEHLAFPTVLAMYAVRQYADGRRVGSKANKNDISSPASKRRRGYQLCHLGTPAEQNAGGWQEMLVETRQAGPADTSGQPARLPCLAWHTQHERSQISQDTGHGRDDQPHGGDVRDFARTGLPDAA